MLQEYVRKYTIVKNKIGGIRALCARNTCALEEYVRYVAGIRAELYRCPKKIL